MMGTSLTEGLIVKLMKRKPEMVNVWLDPDPAGVTGTSKALKTLRSLGFTARAIRSTRDPKLHSRDEIKELLV